jgi:hypothetical protein
VADTPGGAVTRDPAKRLKKDGNGFAKIIREPKEWEYAQDKLRYCVMEEDGRPELLVSKRFKGWFYTKPLTEFVAEKEEVDYRIQMGASRLSVHIPGAFYAREIDGAQAFVGILDAFKLIGLITGGGKHRTPKNWLDEKWPGLLKFLKSLLAGEPMRRAQETKQQKKEPRCADDSILRQAVVCVSGLTALALRWSIKGTEQGGMADPGDRAIAKDLVKALVESAFLGDTSRMVLFFGGDAERSEAGKMRGGLPLVLTVTDGVVDLAPVQDALRRNLLPATTHGATKLLVEDRETMSAVELFRDAFMTGSFLVPQLLDCLQREADLRAAKTVRYQDRLAIALEKLDNKAIRRELSKHVRAGQRRFHKPVILHYGNDVGRTGGKGRLIGLFSLPTGEGHFGVPVEHLVPGHSTPHRALPPRFLFLNDSLLTPEIIAP